jgi:hypothetical protein
VEFDAMQGKSVVWVGFSDIGMRDGAAIDDIDSPASYNLETGRLDHNCGVLVDSNTKYAGIVCNGAE